MSNLGRELFQAAGDGHVNKVSALLKDHPDINVNWLNYYQRTALHAASDHNWDYIVSCWHTLASMST